MKKILALFFFILVAIFLPSILPFTVKKAIFDQLTKNTPGAFTVSEIDFNWFSKTTFGDVTWEYKNTRVKFLKVDINASLSKIFLEKAIPVNCCSGTIYYKDKILFDHVKAEPSIRYKDKKLTIAQDCTITAAVVEEGVEAFTNHALIPPFSSPLVSLHLCSFEINSSSKHSLKMEGDLRLGTLKCAQNHLLTTVLSLLREKPTTYTTVECGIMPFIVQNGVVSFDRTHFLVDKAFEMISLGTVNLMSDGLNIHVGLTTSSLIRAFDLTFLPPGYMVPFKIEGTTHKPEIQVKEALKTIAALILLEKIAPQNRIYPKTQAF